MATDAKVRIRGEDATGKAFRSASNNLKGLSKLAGVAAGSFAGMAAALSIREFAKFEKSMAEVNTLLGDSQNIEDYTKSVKALSLAFGVDQTEQAKAMYQVISAGASTAAVATEVLAQANALALGGVTDIATAADGLTSVMNAYGAKASDAAGISDIFFATMKNGKTTVGELSANIGSLAPLASQLGIGFNEIGAATATLTASGVSTSESMTQLQSVMSALVKITPKAAAEAEKLKISFSQKGLTEAGGLAEFIKKIKTAIDEHGTDQSLGNLFGRVEGIKALMPLAGAQAELYAENLDLISNAAGSTDAAVELMQKTLGFRWDKTTTRVKDLAIAFGDWLSPAIGVVLTGFEALNGSTKALEKEFLGLTQSQLRAGLLEVDAALMETSNNLATYASKFTDAQKEFESYKLSVKGMEDRITALNEKYNEGVQKLAGLSEGLDEAADASEGLKTPTDENTEALTGFSKAAETATDKINKLYSEINSGTGSAIGLETIQVTAKKTSDKLKDVKTDIESLFNNPEMFGDFNDQQTKSTDFVLGEWERFKGGVHDAFYNAIRSGDNFFSSLKNVAFDILAQIAAKIASTFVFDKLGIGGSGGGIGDLFKGLLGGGEGGGIMDTVKGIFGKGGSLGTMAAKVGGSMSSGIASMSASLGAAAPYAMAAIAAGMLLKKLFSGGRSDSEIFGDELGEANVNQVEFLNSAGQGSGFQSMGSFEQGGFIGGAVEELKKLEAFARESLPGVNTMIQDNVLRVLNVDGVAAVDNLVKAFGDMEAGAASAGDATAASFENMAGNSINSFTELSEHSKRALESLLLAGERVGVDLAYGFEEFQLEANAQFEELSSGGIDSMEALSDYWESLTFDSKSGVFDVYTQNYDLPVAQGLPPVNRYDVGTPLVTKSGLAYIDEGERILTKAENKAFGTRSNVEVNAPANNEELTRAVWSLVSEMQRENSMAHIS